MVVVVFYWSTGRNMPLNGMRALAAFHGIDVSYVINTSSLSHESNSDTLK